ncbi:MAG: glycoside hydrolase family 73 protein [Chloroflexi bacterium]|nr:glycoside hydrolase family 73 protein [Chloroflexota bacterium]
MRTHTVGGLAFLYSALAAAHLLGVTADPAAAARSEPLPAPAATSVASSKQEQFFETYAAAAIESMQSTGVPASVTLAQAALESAWGASRLARQANNFFGIKGSGKPGSAGVVWMNTWEVLQGRSITVRAPFRAYYSVAESFTDHGRLFIENWRYARAMAVSADPKAFAREIARAGYATDPSYAQKLTQLMDRYDLYRFDAQTRY